ncbi:hypothetical protein IAU59_005884 [Kwoniella sp. CBS 9459]
MLTGHAAERITPVRNLLSPSHSRGSPDRWADRYTTPKHALSPSSSLARSSQGFSSASSLAASSRPQLTRTETFDVALKPSSDTELARACGRLPSKHNLPMILPDESPSCEECYHLGDSASEDLPQESRPAANVMAKHKYARPGHVFDGSKAAEARAAEVAAELGALTQPAPKRRLTDLQRDCILPPSTSARPDAAVSGQRAPRYVAETTGSASAISPLETVGTPRPSRPPVPQLSVLERVRLLNSVKSAEQPEESRDSRRPLGMFSRTNGV